MLVVNVVMKVVMKIFLNETASRARTTTWLACLLCFSTAVTNAFAQTGTTPISQDASVYFIWPKDGAVLKDRKFWVRFGLRHAGIAPAGIDQQNTGHHHLVIDAQLPALDEEIPADQNYVHFGKGQSEALIELTPGQHTLQLLFADHLHIPHDPPVISEQITITVQ